MFRFTVSIVFLCVWTLSEIVVIEKQKDTIYSGHMLFEVAIPMWSLCAQFCSRVQVCKSINFIAWNKTCKINDCEPVGNKFGLIKSVGNSFVSASSLPKELAGPCKGHDCKINEVCTPQNPTYACVPLLVVFVEMRTSGQLTEMLIHVAMSLDTYQMELCGQFTGPAVCGQVIVTTCNPLPEGQIVKLTSVNNKKEPFHLAEVEVSRPIVFWYFKIQDGGRHPIYLNIGEGSLVSQSKKTGQSTYHTCPSDYLCKAGAGVDGIKEPKNMFHTDSERQPFWWVNLDRVYKVLKVVSTNRIGLYGDRLRQMLVHVGESLETSHMELCGQFIGPSVSGQVIVTQCKTLPEGQIVKLTSVNNKPAAFFLTEVEVYGV